MYSTPPVEYTPIKKNYYATEEEDPEWMLGLFQIPPPSQPPPDMALPAPPSRRPPEAPANQMMFANQNAVVNGCRVSYAGPPDHTMNQPPPCPCSPRQEYGMYYAEQSNADCTACSTLNAYHRQRTADNDCDFQPRVLRRTESGSFFIPSDHTAVSDSPAGVRSTHMSGPDSHHTQYSLLRSAKTTVPLPVYSQHSSDNMALYGRKLRGNCSWRCLTMGLAMVLFFSLAVISYLTVLLLSATPPTVFVSELNGADVKSVSFMTGRPLPQSFSLGDTLLSDLPPGLSFAQFVLQIDSHVQFNLSIALTASLAVYGRQTLQPSLTNYDFTHIVHGTRLGQRQERSVDGAALRHTTFTEPLRAGRWFLGFLNDGSELETVRIMTGIVEISTDCPNNCFDAGDCIRGRCHCYSGYSGVYCEHSMCPLLCSGNGVFAGGACVCHEGWKGPECSVSTSACLVSDCNGNGHCSAEGVCECAQGYGGEFCEQKSCPGIPPCSDHGVCKSGICYCSPSYNGEACEERDYQCSSECGGHGRAAGAQCICDEGWSGDECNEELCRPHCSIHGTCRDGFCHCSAGYTGISCDEAACPPSCAEHGRCDSGTCVCERGWNGANCAIAGCPNHCSSSGNCVQSRAGLWSCDCNDGHFGKDCSGVAEKECGNGIDDDLDGLIDCADGDCCSTSACARSPTCTTVPDPRAILLRKRGVTHLARFFEQVSFLLDRDSVQPYSSTLAFNKSRTSIVRGRVLAPDGSPLPAVRIVRFGEASDSKTRQGFTLSRLDGSFDLIVNGGGSVKLQFLRVPLRTLYETYSVGWNEFNNVGEIVMRVGRESLPKPSPNCTLTHSVSPFLRTDATEDYSIPAGFNGVIADNRALHLSSRIHGTSLDLVYNSAMVQSYQSLLFVSLVPGMAPPSLRRVSLRVDVAGLAEEREFGAAANLSYTYVWRRRNAYGQKVYGRTWAKVTITYTYAPPCNATVVIHRRIQFSGCSYDVSKLGGWNLNIQHYYDPVGGILQYGSGARHAISAQPVRIATFLGTGARRTPDCPMECFNPTPPRSVSLFAPIALASAPDGGVFVGDYNFVRRVAGGVVDTVLQLSLSDTSHPYHLAVNPLTSQLYVSLPLRRQIWRVNKDGTHSVVVGTGEPCPFDSPCGIGGPGEMMALNYPKGLTFAPNGDLYFVDERSIYVLDSDSALIRAMVKTELGAGSTPTGCNVTHRLNELRLSWPTELHYDSVSQSLLVLDNDVIYRLSGATAEIALGAPSHCHSLRRGEELIKPHRLHGCVSVTSDPASGVIYISETDSKRIHRVRSFDATVQVFAGRASSCDCDREGCPCRAEEDVPATDAHLHKPGAIVYTHAGLLVADRGNLKLLLLSTPALQLNDQQQYDINDGARREVHTFNRYGHHISTRDSLTNLPLYNFTYHIDTSRGKLTQITDSSGVKFYIKRSRDGRFITLENSQSHLTQLVLNQRGLLTRVQTPHREERMVYGEGELVFAYDMQSGRLSSAGNVSFGASIAEDQYVIDAEASSKYDKMSFQFDQQQTVESGLLPQSTFGHSSFHRPAFSIAYAEQSKQHHSVMERVISGTDVAQRATWRTYVNTANETEFVRRVLQVNGERALIVAFDRPARIDRIYDGKQRLLGRIHYGVAGHITQLDQVDRATLKLTYDALWRETDRRYVLDDSEADSSVSRSTFYDRQGRVIRREVLRGAKPTALQVEYGYGDNDLMPNLLTLNSPDSTFNLTHDSARLTSVSSPTAGSFNITYSMNTTSFLLPGYAQPFVISRDERSNIVLLNNAHSAHKYTYDAFNRPLTSGSLHQFSYDQETGYLESGVTITAKNKEFGLFYDYYNDGQLKSVYDTRPKATTVTASYSYDSHLRLASIQISLSGVLQTPLKFEYEDNRLANVASMYRIEREGMGTTIAGNNWIIQRTQNAFGQRTRDIYKTSDAAVLFDIEYSYIGTQLQSVKRGEQTAYYEYSSKGLTRFQDGETVITFGYDSAQRLVKMNEEPLQLDERGLIVQQDERKMTRSESGSVESIGDVRFKYDTLGRAIEASSSHFVYDAQNRLIATDEVFYYYLRDDKPWLLTNSLRNGEWSAYFYDESDCLFAMQRGNAHYLIVTTADGSVTEIVDSLAQTVKRRRYGPFGAIMSDSNSEFYLPFGHRGLVQTQHFIVGREDGLPYDPVLGQYLSINAQHISRRLHNDEPYRLFNVWAVYANNDPTDADRLDINDSLTELQNRYIRPLHPTVPVRLAAALNLTTRARLQLQNSEERFRTLGTVLRSALT